MSIRHVLLDADDDLFDVSCYSCDVGAAKPDPAFFHRALARIGAVPEAVLFVDDTQSNVEGARSVRLRAERWHLDEEYDALLARLGRHGVALPGMTEVCGERLPR